MNREELLEKVAPCSLMCYTCSSYCNGTICNTSKEMLHHLDGIKEFYNRHAKNISADYSNFEMWLKSFSCASCKGCRSSEHYGCSIKGCFILECTKSHGVSFCGECKLFPCSRVGDLFEDEVLKQWYDNNRIIRYCGVEEFYNKNKDTPHYKAYKNDN